MDETSRTAGGTLMVALEGPSLDATVASRLSELRPAGVILFRRNLHTPEEVAELGRRLRQVLGEDCLLAIDQEGGRVSRLAPWIGPTPRAADLARAGEKTIREFARATARALRALAIDVDFAPVVDLCTPDVPNGIADRAFGTDPEAVTRLAGAWLRELQRCGVAGCLKHFPGLGTTVVDSHVELPTIPRTAAELERLDLLPYRRLAPEAACVMVGHGYYPEIDGSTPLPASLSRTIVHGLLRGKVGYRGLIVSDDLEMGAVRHRDANGAAAVQAIEAGCDLLLYCGDLHRAETAAAALAARAACSEPFRERLREAASAVGRTARRWRRPRDDFGEWASARDELARFVSLG